MWASAVVSYITSSLPLTHEDTKIPEPSNFAGLLSKLLPTLLNHTRSTSGSANSTLPFRFLHSAAVKMCSW